MSREEYLRKREAQKLETSTTKRMDNLQRAAKAQLAYLSAVDGRTRKRVGRLKTTEARLKAKAEELQLKALVEQHGEKAWEEVAAALGNGRSKTLIATDGTLTVIDDRDIIARSEICYPTSCTAKEELCVPECAAGQHVEVQWAYAEREAGARACAGWCAT